MSISNALAKIGTVTLEVLIVSLFDLCAFVPMISCAIFRKNPYFHQKVVSDIPGNPHAFDNSVISMFRTLPEPSNFNIIWTGIPMDEPLLVRGQLPIARISSLTLYGAGKSDPPNSVDLRDGKLTDHDNFEVALVPSKSTSTAQVQLGANDWPRGLLAMRNYLIPPGTAVNTPEIVVARTGEVMRPSVQYVAGAATLGLLESNEYKGLVQFLKVNAIVTIVNTVLLRSVVCWKTNILIMVLAVLLSWGLYHLCYQVGRRGLQKLCTGACAEANKLYLSSLEQGAKTSQPSRLHKYWIMRYDISQPGQELSVTGRINRTYQQYWSLVVYDQYGLPLPQYVYDANVTEIPSQDGDGNVYSYDIRMRNTAQVRGHRSPTKREGLTDIEVGAATKGYVLFRLVHPMADDELAVRFSNPATQLLNSPDCNKAKNE